jgi:hypothetical protein
MSSIIVVYSTAVTTTIVGLTNLYVIRLCREASRQGRAVRAKFGMLPSVEIEGTDNRHEAKIHDPVTTK